MADTTELLTDHYAPEFYEALWDTDPVHTELFRPEPLVMPNQHITDEVTVQTLRLGRVGVRGTQDFVLVFGQDDYQAMLVNSRPFVAVQRRTGFTALDTRPSLLAPANDVRALEVRSYTDDELQAAQLLMRRRQVHQQRVWSVDTDANGQPQELGWYEHVDRFVPACTD